MDLSRVANDKKLVLCRRYCYAGLWLLPFVWLVNSIWFFNEAFRKPVYPEQKQIKTYVIYSIVGTVVWAIVLTAWIVTYQLNRVSWGQFGDEISFISPLGAP